MRVTSVIGVIVCTIVEAGAVQFLTKRSRKASEQCTKSGRERIIHPPDDSKILSQGDLMKKRLGPFLFVLLMGLMYGAWGQEHYAEGPVWRVQLIRVKPGKLDAYLTSLRKSTKPILDEEKKQGVIMDYKVFLKETKSNPEDWDIAVALQFKNHAALDGLAAKGEEVRDKIVGKQAMQDVTDKRSETREIVSSDLMQEVWLK